MGARWRVLRSVSYKHRYFGLRVQGVVDSRVYGWKLDDFH